MKSRLKARCGRCQRSGPRDEFYLSRPGELPSFDDVCPNCKSNNIEVYDPVVHHVIAQQHAESDVRHQEWLRNRPSGDERNVNGTNVNGATARGGL